MRAAVAERLGGTVLKHLADLDPEVIAKAFAWADNDPLAGIDAPRAGHLDDAKSALDLKFSLASHDGDRLTRQRPWILRCRATSIGKRGAAHGCERSMEGKVVTVAFADVVGATRCGTGWIQRRCGRRGAGNLRAGPGSPFRVRLSHISAAALTDPFPGD
jgi:hypothetical protein